MKIAILLGSPDISGGTYVIFQHALFLQEHGDEVTIITEEHVTPERISWHPAAKDLRIVNFHHVEAETFDLAIGTWWRTLFELHRVAADRYGYFVQSIESRFYPEVEAPLRKLADSTYLLPLPVITEANWIKATLERDYSRAVYLAPNGIRKDLYRADGPLLAPKIPGRLRVLVEGPVEVSFKNVPKAIELAHQAEADEIWLLTISPISGYPGVDRVFSRLPIHEVPAIYRSCDVVVKLSYVEGMFGPPLEMFHCGGTAITFDVTGHDEYIIHDHNALVAQTDKDGIVVEHLRRLRSDVQLLERLKRGAAATAEAWPEWFVASEVFQKGTRWMYDTSRCDRKMLANMSNFLMQFYAVGENYKREITSAREALLEITAERDWMRHELEKFDHYGARYFLRAGVNRAVRNRLPSLYRKIYQRKKLPSP
jgi:glycosyltransferase involved in cell wall biosynthesis